MGTNAWGPAHFEDEEEKRNSNSVSIRYVMLLLSLPLCCKIYCDLYTELVANKEFPRVDDGDAREEE